MSTSAQRQKRARTGCRRRAPPRLAGAAELVGALAHGPQIRSRCARLPAMPRPSSTTSRVSAPSDDADPHRRRRRPGVPGGVGERLDRDPVRRRLDDRLQAGAARRRRRARAARRSGPPTASIARDQSQLVELGRPQRAHQRADLADHRAGLLARRRSADGRRPRGPVRAATGRRRRAGRGWPASGRARRAGRAAAVRRSSSRATRIRSRDLRRSSLSAAAWTAAPAWRASPSSRSRSEALRSSPGRGATMRVPRSWSCQRIGNTARRSDGAVRRLGPGHRDVAVYGGDVPQLQRRAHLLHERAEHLVRRHDGLEPSSEVGEDGVRLLAAAVDEAVHPPLRAQSQRVEDDGDDYGRGERCGEVVVAPDEAGQGRRAARMSARTTAVSAP